MLTLSEGQPAVRAEAKYGIMPEESGKCLLSGPVNRLAAGITGPVDHRTC
jgi:hypothetical protein